MGGDGRSYTKIYGVWVAMRNRCNNINNKNYKYYGGRGIKVYSEWEDFTKFLAYIKVTIGLPSKGLTLDRINNNGNYEPNNIRWATWRIQGRNTSQTKINEVQAKKIKELYTNTLLTQKDLAGIFKVSPTTIYNIIHNSRR